MASKALRLDLGIAVIISTTRKRPLLDAAIPSVFNQSRAPDIVYIVADSDDQLPPYEIQGLNSGNIRVKRILNQREKNLSGAMNTVFAEMLADGCDPEKTFVAVLDDDDWWEKNYLESCYNLASVSGSDWIVSGIIRHESSLDPGMYLTIPEVITERSLLRGNPHIQGSNLFIRFSKLLLAGGYDENLPSTTDRDIGLRLLALGDVRIAMVRHHLVHHIAYGEGRLSEKGSERKCLGLRRFYYKYRFFMDADDRASFLERAKTLFGCDPELLQETVEEDEVAQTVPEVSGGHIDLVIGVILSEESYLEDLVRGAVELNRRTGSVSVLVVLNNTDLPLNLEDGISNEMAGTGIKLSVVGTEDANESADRGDLGLYYEDRRNRKGIAFGRTALHRFVYLESLKYPDPVVWIIDDDVSLQNLYWGTSDNKITESEFIGHINRWKKAGVSLVVGKVGGDPPVPIMSTSRTQMLDLYYNLRAILGSRGEDCTGNGSWNESGIMKTLPAYFYDFPDKSFRHLEVPVWIEPKINDPDLFSKNAKLILRKGVFRQASYPVNGGDHGEMRYDSDTEEFGPVRGGNTIILDIDCLRDFSNSSPRSGDVSYRRGDTLWVILNRRLGSRRPLRQARIVISSPLMLIQDRRKDESPTEMRVKLVADTLGSAFVRSMDMVLFRKNRSKQVREDYFDPLNFTDSDVKDILDCMKREIRKRVKQISLNFWRIRGLIQSIRSVLTHNVQVSVNLQFNEADHLEGISEICDRMENLFSEDKISNILQEVKNFNKGDLVDFLYSLSHSCRQYGDALPIHYSESDKEELKTRIRGAYGTGEFGIIGSGKEGIVFSDRIHAYKYFHYGKYALDGSNMRFLNETILGKKFSGLAKLESISFTEGHLILKEEYVPGIAYNGGEIGDLVTLLQECRTKGIVIKNIAPKNLIKSETGLKFVDLGRDLEPYSEDGYRKMCRRAYITYRWHFRRDIHELLRRSNGEQDFPEFFGFQYFLDLLGDMHTDEISVPFVARELDSVHHAKILDYGCGTGQIADELSKSNSVSVYDKDMSGFYRRHPAGSTSLVMSKDDLNKILSRRDKFDVVLVSLVLCTVSDREVKEILFDVRRLVKGKGELVVVICNPFNVHNRETGTHEKVGPLGNYHDRFTFEKRMKITLNLRHEYHRPLEWYFNELRGAGFQPAEYSESGGASYETVSPGSEFLMIRAHATETPKEYDVSLMIKASPMEWRSIGFQVRHIVKQLEISEKFKEKYIITDNATGNFARQYDTADLVSFDQELRRLQEGGIIDSVVHASEDVSILKSISERWFGTKCSGSKSRNGQPVLTTLQGFEQARSKYILQMDSDCIICRDATEKSYLREMIDVLESNKNAITASFSVFNQSKSPFVSGNESGKWRTEVRNCIIHRERLFSLTPIPNSIGVEGKLELPWHRSLDIKLASGPWESYRGSAGNACFIHVPNSLKVDLNFWYNAIKYHENSPPRAEQLGHVDLQNIRIQDFLEPRNEEMIVLVKGRNVPISKVRRCFHSLLEQDFQEFGVIYVDAASKNGSDEYVQYIGKSLFQNRLTVFRNYVSNTSMENIFIAVRGICRNPSSIIIMLDADDALIGKDTLSKVRSRYKKGADLTVGTMIRTDKYKKYPVDFDSPRLSRGGNVWQHLRTFRKYLFDSIQEEDLKIQGKWIAEADDWAYMIPMVELSEHPEVINDIIYFYEPSPEKESRDINRYEDTIAMVVSKRSYRRMVAR